MAGTRFQLAHVFKMLPQSVETAVRRYSSHSLSPSITTAAKVPHSVLGHAAIFGCILSAALLGNAAEPTNLPQDAGSDEARLQRGRQLYAMHCADCHDADGRGAEYRSAGVDIPDFTSGSWSRSRSDSQLQATILFGKGANMPPFEDELGEDDAALLVAVIRALAGLEVAGPATSRIQERLVEFRAEWRDLQAEWDAAHSELFAIRSRRIADDK